MSTTKVAPDLTTLTPTSTAGMGEFKVVAGTVGGALSLPAGGTWAWFGMRRNDAGGTVSAITGGVASGGTEIFAASGGNQAHALVWRVG